MDLSTRLSRLERRPARRRCATCREWPAWRVVYEDDLMDHPAPDVPERCAVCGWEPLTVVVRYVDGDDWRGRA
jgi:hypothetical protein